jgi:hypothetical protein
MAHSNLYFQMEVLDGREISLTSRTEEWSDANQPQTNMIQMIVRGPVYGTGMTGDVGVYLTEQQQDDLIMGILERRGIRIKSLSGWAEGYTEPLVPIEPTSNQKSRIHPPKEI